MPKSTPNVQLTTAPQTRQITVIDNAGRTILALMTVTVIFSLIGDEISAKPKPGQTGYGAVAPGHTVNALGQAQGASINPFMIILGGTLAAGVLTLIAHAGEAGEKLGVGLALLAMLTSTLVYGKPVWDAANNAFGSTPTAGSGATTPTTGTSTVTALAQGTAAGIG